ncbi:L-lactate dehydrogenase [Clostridium sp.]|uniref:L-lactate dehydrogenase n=1 Tax=Clostridium sp. TaxID=1506 RepID=UPI003FA56923
MSKIGIIGCGFVGSTIAYTLAVTGLVNEIVIVDLNKEKADGDALDISHGISLVKPIDIYAGDISDLKDCNIIVLTAGVNRVPSSSRLELTRDNVNIFKSLIPEIASVNEDAIYLVVSNPVDVLTYVTHKILGKDHRKVIGSGTVLDSSRYRYILSRCLDIDPRNIHAYIIGEHGDTEFPVWSSTSICGMSLSEYCAFAGNSLTCDNKIEIEKQVRGCGMEIIKKKGATYYAVAMSVMRIIECILRDERSILPVSSLINGCYGIRDVSLSLPTILSSDGVDKVIETTLSDSEINKLIHSANTLKEVIRGVGF